MGDVALLLDKAKKTLNANSDAELARQLGVTRASVSNWRTGRNLPDVVQCATLAGLTGEPLAKVLGIVGEARAISREEKSVWRKLAASAVTLFVLLGATTLPGTWARDAHAQDGTAFRVTQASSAYYVKPGKAFLTLIGDVLRWLRWRFTGRKPGPDNIEAFAA